MKLDLIEKTFGDTQVLGDIYLSVERGETVALTGPSGVGKSTLMRIISGLDPVFDGTLTGVGRVGIVFQEPTLLPWRSALDNILIATGCDKSNALAALAQVELGKRHAAFPSQLSLGQQRRVALARALAANPDTLILDEAFASLDEATASRMRSLTRGILQAANYHTFIVTHHLQDAVELADRVLLLDSSPARIRGDYRFSTSPHCRGQSEELDILRQKLQQG
ncbi:MAG: ATP-binding cassette domain-containing protein [Rhodobacteraceae bacterium]|nr:ATP-binding cassette domain-containing protein [Paracoccaceae bacterium]